MSNPWDPFPFPTQGDNFERKTFAAVGLVISHWEAIEFELARLHSVFVGDPDGEALQTHYGAGLLFQHRLASLRTDACKYFCRSPNQAYEGEFDRLTTFAEGFASRRNDVAHGIVIRVDRITHFRNLFSASSFGSAPHHALIPPLYTLRRHKDGLPTYAYTSVELKLLAGRLLRLVTDIRAFRDDLAGSLPERT